MIILFNQKLIWFLNIICTELVLTKTFSTSYAVNSLTGSYIGEGSGSYSIVDVASGDTIVPFSAYTSMSCDSTSNYFTQYLNGFHPDRVYRILYKLKIMVT